LVFLLGLDLIALGHRLALYRLTRLAFYLLAHGLAQRGSSRQRATRGNAPRRRVRGFATGADGPHVGTDITQDGVGRQRGHGTLRSLRLGLFCLGYRLRLSPGFRLHYRLGLLGHLFS
jgi:hypothetical protein